HDAQRPAGPPDAQEAEGLRRFRASARGAAAARTELLVLPGRRNAPRLPLHYATDMAASDQINAVGRRKTSTARVYISPGTGQITINRRPFENYFPVEWRRKVVLGSLAVTGTEGQFDVLVNVRGG